MNEIIGQMIKLDFVYITDNFPEEGSRLFYQIFSFKHSNIPLNAFGLWMAGFRAIYD